MADTVKLKLRAHYAGKRPGTVIEAAGDEAARLLRRNMAVEVPASPPAKSAGKDEWRAYVDSRDDLDVKADATKDELIEAVESAGA